MKKILMGLVAISAAAFGASVEVGAEAAQGTNVFQTGQTGAINITGKVTSDVEVVKYVVFASSDDGTTKEDTLALTDFVLTTGDNGGFKGTNPKVYVKQVNADNVNVENIGEAFAVDFKVKTESIESDWFTNQFEMLPTQFFDAATLNEIITNANTGYSFQVVNGVIANDAVIYAQAKSVHFKVTAKGELEVVSDARTLYTDRKITSAAAKFDAAFVGGKTITNAKIMVKVG